MATALRLLRGRVRSSHELRQSLTAHGLPADQIPRIVRECERRGILDDEAAARLWAQQWADRGYGWPAIRHRLLAKGFSEQTAASAGQRLGVSAAAEAQRANAWAARQRRRGVPRQRILRQLASRGFDPELMELRDDHTE